MPLTGIEHGNRTRSGPIIPAPASIATIPAIATSTIDRMIAVTLAVIMVWSMGSVAAAA